MRTVSRYSSRRRRRSGLNYKKIGTMVTLLVFLLLTFASVRFFTLFNALKGSDSPVVWRPNPQERTQFLLIGLSKDQLSAVTLVSVPGDSEVPVALLKIPAETLVFTSNQEQRQPLSEIWQDHGQAELIASLNQLLGYYLPAKYTFVYDMTGFPDVVRGLKNVPITLEMDLKVRQGDTDYLFYAGTNTLTPENVLPLLSHGLGDPLDQNSVRVHNRVLVGVFNDLFLMQNIGNLVDNIRLVNKYYQTGMGVRDLSRFRDTLAALDSENSHVLFLPGQWVNTGGDRLWAVDNITAGLVARQITENIPRYDPEALIIDVFNGNGVQGFAGRTAENLKAKNYKIGLVTNSQEIDKTEIYYHPDFRMAALELGTFFETEPVYIEGSYPGSTNPVAIVLGKDLK